MAYRLAKRPSQSSFLPGGTTLGPEPPTKRAKFFHSPISAQKRASWHAVHSYVEGRDIAQSVCLSDKDSRPRSRHEFMAPSSFSRNILSSCFPASRKYDSQELRVSGSTVSIALATDVATYRNDIASIARHKSVQEDGSYNSNPWRFPPLSIPADTSPSPRLFPEMNYPSISQQHQPLSKQLPVSNGLTTLPGTLIANPGVPCVPRMTPQQLQEMSSFYFDRSFSMDAGQFRHFDPSIPCSSYMVPNTSASWYPDEGGCIGNPWDPSRRSSTSSSYCSNSPFGAPPLCRDSSSSPASPSSISEFITPIDTAAVQPDVVEALADAIHSLGEYDERCGESSMSCLPEETTQDQSYQLFTPDYLADTETSPQFTFSSHFSPFDAGMHLAQATEMLGQKRDLTPSFLMPSVTATQLEYPPLSPTAFYQSPPTLFEVPLHHPRPRRPYIPAWQCDPDIDLDRLVARDAPRASPVQLVDSTPCSDVTTTASNFMEEMEADDMMEDIDGSEVQWEGNHDTNEVANTSDPYWQDHEAQGVEVGPAMGLGSSTVRVLDSQCLLFQSVPDCVKYPESSQL